MPVFAAVDLGASGGRVMRGTIDGERIALEDVHRFANGVADVDGHLRWDFTRLHREVLAGLERIPEAASVGVDTWGVDYGLLDANGELVAEPIAYRDERTSKVIDDVHGLVGRRRALHDDRHPVPAVQHHLSTRGRAAAARAGNARDTRCCCPT